MQLWSKAQPQVGTLSGFLLISRTWQTPGTQAISSRLIPIFFADAVPFYIHCNSIIWSRILSSSQYSRYRVLLPYISMQGHLPLSCSCCRCGNTEQPSFLPGFQTL